MCISGGYFAVILLAGYIVKPDCGDEWQSLWVSVCDLFKNTDWFRMKQAVVSEITLSVGAMHAAIKKVYCM